MLTQKNEMTYLHRELLARILKFFFENNERKGLDRLPIEFYPKNSISLSCCIYKDRALLREKILAILGINLEEDDETRGIDFFLQKAIKREKIEEPILTVVDIACNSCDGGYYYVTDTCQGCMARPCEVNCHFEAIKVVNGRAHIDRSKCKNCGMCKEVCPYNAITYKPVPCEENCPVDAIAKDENGKAKIDHSKCIYCGKCVTSCPFGAIMERSQIIDVAKHITSSKLVALVAPSIVGQFPGNVRQLVSALKKIGFTKVYEVASGAEKTAQREAKELTEKVEDGRQEFMTTSCCPAYVLVVKKHLPQLSKYVSSTPSPMAFTAKMAKEENSNCITVFIGPCVAKKQEAIENENVDYVLNFEEIGAFFIALGVDVREECEMDFDSPPSNFTGRGFPVSGGVIQAVREYLQEPYKDVKYTKIDGLNRKNVAFLKRLVLGKEKIDGLLEVMACEGGCVGGPGVISNPMISMRKIENYSQERKSVMNSDGIRKKGEND